MLQAHLTKALYLYLTASAHFVALCGQGLLEDCEAVCVSVVVLKKYLLN